MRNYKLASSVGMLAIAVCIPLLLMLWSVVMLWSAYTLGFGSLSNPGPGWFPAGVGLGLGVCALTMAWAPSGQERSRPRLFWAHHRSVFMTALALLIFIWVVPWVGWGLGLALMLWVVTLSDGRWKSGHRAMFVVLCSVLLILIFHWGFQVSQPLWTLAARG